MLNHRYTNPNSVVQADVNAIATAKAVIHFAAYSLTHPAIIAALKNAAASGVEVDIYLDRSELEAEARGNPDLPGSPLAELLNVPRITIRVKASLVLMHLKSYCVDQALLRDGSANFSPQGEAEQDNSMTLTDDPAAVTLFLDKFCDMWSRPDNLSVNQAVQHSAVTASSLAHRR